ncbi:MAG: toll/interleukin-1 receptor domain-containing protein, partial [Clostridiales bacterium]|nr:toll/interleukin-1 receptor domain-containing protein [Candidatus Blautia equi]
MAEYTYDAFISYRHCEKDKYVAEKLHEMLESYRLPASIRKNHEGGKTKINRVFRDKDELPLTNNLEDPIMKALSSSEYLIVICSPRLKESIWCRREIETFIQMHGRQNVLAVLIEGEPSDSFPDELLYAEEVVKHPDGTEETVKKMLEPLAADFRGETTGEIKKAMK